MIELLVENKADGKIYEISELVTSINFNDSLNNGCSKLDFSYLNNGNVFSNGSIVRFRYNDANIFYGYIFSYERNRDDVSITAYDQLRYLKAKDTYVVKNLRVDEVIRDFANRFQLMTGILENTNYKLPTAIKDNQTYLDIIYDCISTTLMGTGHKYAFYDSFGSLRLTNIKNMQLPLVIGDESLAYDYKYSQSIDENTYNRIKISKDNEKTGKRDIYIAQDSSSFKRFGILQYFETADKDANAEQLKAKADSLLKLMNAETKTCSIDALGDTRIRAGNSVLFCVSELNINQYLIVKSVKHNFKAGNHTMSLELML